MKHSTLTMFRRVMAMTLALLLVVGLTGCFGKEDPDPTEEPTEIVTEAPTDTATEAPTEAPTEKPTEPPVKGVMGTVSANNLNVRSNPSTDSSVLNRLPVNLRVEILEQKTVSGTNWGRIGEMTLTDGTKVTGGWLNLHYVKLDTTEAQTPTEPGTSTGTTTTPVDPDEEALGTITAQQLQIRKGAGTTYDAAGSYKKCDRVKILEQKTVSGTTWGRTEKGWISMTYVKLDGSAGSAVDTGTNVKQPGATTPTTGSSSGTGTGTGTGTAALEVSNGKTTILGYVVVDCDGLTLRTGPGKSYKSLGTADEGDRYPYYQTSNKWYRTSHCWLSNADDAYLYIEGTTAADAGIAVVKAKEMNVRQGPGTNFKSLTTLKQGESLVVLGRSDGWGYTRLGWINLDTDYVTFTKGLTYTTGDAEVIVDGLNVRESASTEAKSKDNLDKGDKVKVTEIDATNKSWGKITYGTTDKTGYVNLSYLKMTSSTGSSSGGSSSSTTTYSITIPSSTNGTVSASAASIESGKTVTLYVTPATDYKLGTLTVSKASGGTVTATAVTGTTNYTFTMPASNVTVNATFVGKDSTEHTVTINSGAGGTVVTANGASKFASGTDVYLTVTPAAGYKLKAIAATNTTTTVADDMNVAIGTDHSFKMPAGNVTVNATFEKVDYKAEAGTAVTGATVGSITNADTTKTVFNYGDTVNVTVSTTTGYKVKAVKVTYGSNTITATADATTAGKYTFIMPPADSKITVEVEKINYTVTVAATQNGTASVDKPTAALDDTVTVTATPSNGFTLGEIKVNGTAITGTTFSMPAANVEVTVTFVANS